MSDPAAPAGSPPRTHRESERKFRVHALFRPPDISLLPSVGGVEPQDTRRMTAVYHDTDDLTLFRWGITLRRREGGPDEGWHMKLPVEGETEGVRDEVQLPLAAGDVGQVPSPIQDLVTALTRGAALVPIVTLRTERQPVVLMDAEGESALEMVDDTVSILDGEEIVERFREIEVEALTPTAAEGQLLDDVCAAIVAAGGEPGARSKAASAVGPRAADPPDVPEPQTAGPDDPAAMAVQAHLLRHARRLLLQDVRVRRDLPDSVHQMRVAARRLRSGLKAFGPLVDAQWARDLRAELGWIAGELGAVRDTEVMIERLDRHAAELDDEESAVARAAVDTALGRRMADARAHALVAMRSERYQQLLADLVDGVQHPKFTAAAQRRCRDVLPELVDKAWRRLAKDVGRLHQDSPARPWHEARIAAKKARYSAEAVEPVFGKQARKLARALAQVTELLGDHQDAHVAQATLTDIAGGGGLDSRSGFALGLLYGVEVEHEMDLRRRFRRLWPEVVKVHRKTRLDGG